MELAVPGRGEESMPFPVAFEFDMNPGADTIDWW